MNRHTVRNIACALALNIGIFNASLAQSNAQPDGIAIDTSEPDWTALAIAPDGSWGVAIEIDTSRAITQAITNCKIMHKKEIGCGYQMTLIQAGWSLAIRCGGENIIASEKNIADAEQSAVNRENELRRIYVPNMPACIHVVTIDPRGVIIMPKLNYRNARR